MKPLIAAAACCTLAASASLADTVSIPALQDTTLFQNNPNNSGGGGPGLFVGTEGTGSPRRALIQFDISDNLPAGATVTGVSLTLTLAMTAGGSGGSGGTSSATISLFDVSDAWAQGTNQSTATGVGGTGQGVLAQTGDATWAYESYNMVTWATAGGDHSSAASATLALTGNTTGTAYIWNSADAGNSNSTMIADVQNWLVNPSVNFGWELINADERSPRTLYSFYSSEWGTKGSTAPSQGGTGNPAQDPVLQVTYTLPEPCSFTLLLAGAAGLAVARRR